MQRRRGPVVPIENGLDVLFVLTDPQTKVTVADLHKNCYGKYKVTNPRLWFKFSPDSATLI